MLVVEIWDKEANEGKGDYIKRRAVDAREILAGDKEGKRFLAEQPEAKAKGKSEEKPEAKAAK